MAKKQKTYVDDLVEISKLLDRCAEINRTLETNGHPAMSQTDYDNIVRAAKHLVNKSKKAAHVQSEATA